ncbi:hypothetical protein OPIT5_04730 [Opitutaceae bacterium TAV5]|nr:hypothetical protein OPIT5_04730 [Opitutaceae bacterium TAV5]
MKNCRSLLFLLFIPCLVLAARDSAVSSGHIARIEKNLNYIEQEFRNNARVSSVELRMSADKELLLSLAHEVLALRKETDALRIELDVLKKENEKNK